MLSTTSISPDRRVIVALAAAILFITALAAPISAGQQADRVAVGDTAIDFTMDSIDGETFNLAAHRGEKTTVLIFFRGTW